LTQPKKVVAGSLVPLGTARLKTILEALGVARSNIAAQTGPEPTRQWRARRPQPEAELVAEIKAPIAVSRPTATGASIGCSGVSVANKAARQ
jgi:hypothetical protein